MSPPTEFQLGTNLISDASGYILNPPDPTSTELVASLPWPVKEKSICSSVGLKVRDSAAPLNFLNVPEPM